MKHKRLIYEVLGIVLLSAAAGLIYNYFLPKPLPLFFEKPKTETVSDSVLMMKLNAPVPEKVDTEKKISNMMVEKDTASAKSKPEKVEKVVATAETEVKSTEGKAPTGAKEITYKQLAKFLGNPKILLIDARNKENFSKGRIGNAINIDAYPEDNNLYFKTITELPTDKMLIIYCDGGNCDASHKLAKDILSFGFKNVLVYAGGWEEWILKHKK